MIVYQNTNKFLWGYINMITLTLYKNCRLNNSYQEVLFLNEYNSTGMSSLENYLNSLTKVTFTINDFYYENSGELVIDNSLLIPTL